MMWSKQKSPRFVAGKATATCAVGPGSYELPSVWDDHATTIGGQDRFQEQVGQETPGPATYAQDTQTPAAGTLNWQEAGSLKSRQCKENRPPSPRERTKPTTQLHKEAADITAQLIAARKKVENHESELQESVLARQKLQ
ncbi:nipblb, partial [Symbiodinium sp. CCMP2456]